MSDQLLLDGIQMKRVKQNIHCPQVQVQKSLITVSRLNYFLPPYRDSTNATSFDLDVFSTIGPKPMV